ncbi:hypothetical protein [Vibrio navarrensis]|uniref:hypothetical protein n=1 Tax=Vibrio navarrensis TaxID=29495 RepID=UPI00186A475B|nr:hypothetical protein [Vibrio navarrensis]MBE4620987.1 hypothetical protein [Vibrio navarrensis]
MPEPLLTEKLIPTLSEFLLGRTERLNKSAFTEAAQVIGSPTGLWTARIEFRNIRVSEARELIGFLISLRGASGRFRLFDWSAPSVSGAGGTYPVTDISQSAPGLAMIITALPSTKLASIGDYVEIGGELKALVADVTTDELGKATLLFEPFMRNPITVNTQVNFDKPTGTFRLAPGYKVPRLTDKKMVMASIAVDCIEAVTI